MSRIRCDNAECVVYVDELDREFPRQFSLEVSTRSLGLADDRARRAVEGGAGDPGLERATSLQGLATRQVDREARQRATKAVERPPAIDQTSVAYALAVQLEHARLTAVLASRVARRQCARRLQALIDPNARGGAPSRADATKRFVAMRSTRAR